MPFRPGTEARIFLLSEVPPAPAQWQAQAPFAGVDAALAIQVLGEAGWPALAADPTHGGQGLPAVLEAAAAGAPDTECRLVPMCVLRRWVLPKFTMRCAIIGDRLPVTAVS